MTRAHDRSEAQSVEIVFALLLGVLACLAVVFVSWLLRLLVDTDGGGVWVAGTAIAAIGAGLSVLLRQLVQARRNGL